MAVLAGWIAWERTRSQINLDQKVKVTEDGVEREYGFAKGSMGPKVEAACRFVEKSGKTAVIGALDKIDEILAGRSGTRVVAEEGVVFA